jgi:hypothetical protein
MIPTAPESVGGVYTLPFTIHFAMVFTILGGPEHTVQTTERYPEPYFNLIGFDSITVTFCSYKILYQMIKLPRFAKDIQLERYKTSKCRQDCSFRTTCFVQKTRHPALGRPFCHSMHARSPLS